MILKPLSKFFIAVLFSFSTCVFAETADRSKPIQVEADEGSFQEANQVTIFTGNVVITQGSLNVKAAYVKMLQKSDGEQQILATGKPVYFKQNLDTKKPNGQPEVIKGHGNEVTYNSKTGIIELKNNAKIDREGDLASGDIITYNTNKEIYSVKGSAKKGKRVNVVIQPNTVQKK